MKRISWLGAAFLVWAVFMPRASFPAAANSQSITPATDSGFSAEKRAQVQEAYGNLPLFFIENRGQLDKRVKFYGQSGGQTTWFTEKGVVIALSRPQDKRLPADTMKKQSRHAARQQGPGIKASLVSLRPVGLRKGVKIAALEPQEHKVNYFTGNDPKRWRTDIPTYQALAYQEAYKGIDLKFYGDGRQLEYDIVVKPGADPSLVKFHYAGVKSLELTPAGDLAMKLPDGEVLVQKKPVVYQEVAGVRVPREARFKIARDVAGHTYGFEVAAYDQRVPLVIDPVLIYSNNLGGNNGWIQRGESIQVDAAGCAYVAGETSAIDFPTANPFRTSLSTTTTHSSFFVCKFNAAGNGLVYSTYLRGDHQIIDFNTTPPTLAPAEERIYASGYPGGHLGLAVDASGCAYITGPTYSSDFPTVNPAYGYQGKRSGLQGFVTKLAAAGNALVYSTYMLGTENASDRPRDIALGENGSVYIAGSTESLKLNEVDLQSPYNNRIGFVTKLNAAGNGFVWTRALGKQFLGGTNPPISIGSSPSLMFLLFHIPAECG